MDGLKDAVVKMLAGEEIEINTGTFTNDMVTFATKDDVLTLLLHLGYLTYNVDTKKVRIPNKEVAQEYLNAISTMDWNEVTSSVDVFIPRPYHQDKPAVIMELKWNKNVQGAIAQIKEKQYTDALRDYHGNLLLAGITYDRDSKQHTCVIEKMIKE